MSRLNVANFRHPDGTADNITFDSSTNVTANGNLLFAATSNTADQSIQFGDPDATNRGFFNYRHSEDQLQIGTSGTTKVAVNSDGGFAFNSGYGSVGIAYGVRAWVNFNGRNTLSIYDDGGISSITDNGTGDYTVNFDFTMPDINYAFTGSASYCAAATSAVHTVELRTNTARSTSKTTTAIRHDVVYSDGSQNRTRFDYDEISIVYFR